MEKDPTAKLSIASSPTSRDGYTFYTNAATITGQTHWRRRWFILLAGHLLLFKGFLIWIYGKTAANKIKTWDYYQNNYQDR